MPKSWKLSPSDLTFLWDECPRCFYLKVVNGFNRPSLPMPKIFTRIDLIMKGYYAGKPSSALSPALPEGTVRFGDRWVVSEPIELAGHAGTCYIRGRFDCVLEFVDGSYGVVDFKTTEAKAEHVAFYSRQLEAYAYALENPGPGAFALRPITRLGLLCVEPARMDQADFGQVAYFGNPSWIEIPRDDGQFLEFLGRVVDLLALPEAPPADPDCLFCKYRASARDTGL